MLQLTWHLSHRHCVDSEGDTVEGTCDQVFYDYDVPLRIRGIFAVLATSAIGVFLPVITERFTRVNMDSIVFIGMRQFGTGIIISTALVHMNLLGRHSMPSACFLLTPTYSCLRMRNYSSRTIAWAVSSTKPRSPLSS